MWRRYPPKRNFYKFWSLNLKPFNPKFEAYQSSNLDPHSHHFPPNSTKFTIKKGQNGFADAHRVGIWCGGISLTPYVAVVCFFLLFSSYILFSIYRLCLMLLSLYFFINFWTLNWAPFCVLVYIAVFLSNSLKYGVFGGFVGK